MSERNPKPGDRYRHFKGKLYQVITLAQDAANDEMKVVYQALYGDFKVYVRDYTEFIGEIDHVKYPEAKGKYRFEYVGGLDTCIKQIEPERTEQKASGMQEPEGQKASRPLEPEWQKTNAEQESEQQTETKETEAEMTEIKAVPEEEQINPDLLAFLEAEENEIKIEVLYQIKNRIDERVMSAIEASLDISSSEGSMEDRIMFVRNTLAARVKYEGARLR